MLISPNRRSPFSLFSKFSLLVVLALAGSIVGCGSKEPQTQATAPGKRVDPATAGSINGRIVLNGAPPPAEMIRMTTDPVCAQAAPAVASDALVVSPTGGVANAFVWVKDGLDSTYGFDVPTTPVVLDQKACHYSPRVVGIRVGQPLNINNSDPTLHNVHAIPMSNQEFNQGQPVQNVPITKTFTVAEVPVRFVCNVHGWMRAYVCVVAHPFFAVTDADGSFQLAGLPPGTYTIGVWHETLGTQETKVTVAEKQAVTLPLTFASTTK